MRSLGRNGRLEFCLLLVLKILVLFGLFKNLYVLALAQSIAKVFTISFSFLFL
jgi:hypothetical protein